MINKAFMKGAMASAGGIVMVLIAIKFLKENAYTKDLVGKII